MAIHCTSKSMCVDVQCALGSERQAFMNECGHTYKWTRLRSSTTWVVRRRRSIKGRRCQTKGAIAIAPFHSPWWCDDGGRSKATLPNERSRCQTKGAVAKRKEPLPLHCFIAPGGATTEVDQRRRCQTKGAIAKRKAPLPNEGSHCQTKGAIAIAPFHSPTMPTTNSQQPTVDNR